MCAGTYSVMAFDNNLCPASAVVVVGSPVQIGAVLTPINVSCFGGNDGEITANSVTGGVAPYTYSWSPSGDADPVNSSLSAGAHYLIITDVNGCSETFYQALTEPSAITVTFSYTNISVFGANDGTIFPTVSGGTGPYQFSWIGPGFSSSSLSINGLASGIYTLNITDANGCEYSQSNAINEPNCNVSISPTYTAPLCYGNLGTVYWTNNGGLAPYSNTLTFNGTNTFSGAQYNYPSTPLQLPVGVYGLVVTDASGCTDIWNFAINAPAPITFDISLSDVLCSGGNTGTAAISNIIGGNGGYYINWGGAIPSSLIAGTYNVVVTDGSGCSSGIVPFTINQPNPLVISSVNTTLASCFPINNGTATISGSAGVLPYTYMVNNLPLTSNPTVQSLASGIYTAFLYDDNGC